MWFAKKYLDLSTPQVMGVLNVTPDSFSDGGQFRRLDKALMHAESMIEAGASLIDIGGESTRPGAQEVSESEELERTIKVVEAIHSRFDTVISIDTSKPLIMAEAVKNGAGLINDVRALSLDGALAMASHLVSHYGPVVSLMHMQGNPKIMQLNPQYQGITSDVMDYLKGRLEVCYHAGIAPEKLIIDPGFGFGKTLEHNYQLLSQLEKFHDLKCPLFVGLSRKSMIGNLLKRNVDERLAGSLAAAYVALNKGAKILRVHDVKETMDIVRVHNKVKELETAL